MPVGEGNGEPKLASCSGIFIRKGCILRCLGGEGTQTGGGSESSTND